MYVQPVRFGTVIKITGLNKYYGQSDAFTEDAVKAKLKEKLADKKVACSVFTPKGDLVVLTNTGPGNHLSHFWELFSVVSTFERGDNKMVETLPKPRSTQLKRNINRFYKQFVTPLREGRVTTIPDSVELKL